MATIELQLTPGTLQRAQQIAAARQLSVEALIEEMLDSLGTAASSTDTLLGLFADEPELMDEVVGDAMKAHENHSLRTHHESCILPPVSPFHGISASLQLESCI